MLGYQIHQEFLISLLLKSESLSWSIYYVLCKIFSMFAQMCVKNSKITPSFDSLGPIKSYQRLKSSKVLVFLTKKN